MRLTALLFLTSVAVLADPAPHIDELDASPVKVMKGLGGGRTAPPNSNPTPPAMKGLVGRISGAGALLPAVGAVAIVAAVVAMV